MMNESFKKALADVESIEYPKQEDLFLSKSFGAKTGDFVAIKPCNKKFKDKTYLGIFVCELPLSISLSINDDKKSLNVKRFMYNPMSTNKELKNYKNLINPLSHDSTKQQDSGVRREMIKWLKKFDDVDNAERYADWLYKQYGSEAIEYTWKKSKMSSVVDGKAGVKKLADHYKKKLGNKTEIRKPITFAKSPDDEF